MKQLFQKKLFINGKDTILKANHNTDRILITRITVVYQWQRYNFESKSQLRFIFDF